MFVRLRYRANQETLALLVSSQMICIKVCVFGFENMLFLCLKNTSLIVGFNPH